MPATRWSNPVHRQDNWGGMGFASIRYVQWLDRGRPVQIDKVYVPPTLAEISAELRGKDLACRWGKKRCHAT
jgi:hypothetical protein